MFIRNLISLASFEVLFSVFSNIFGVRGAKFSIGDSVSFNYDNSKAKGFVKFKSDAYVNKHIIEMSHISSEFVYGTFFEKKTSKHANIYEKSMVHSPCLLCEKKCF